MTVSVLIENHHQTVTLTSWCHGTWTAYASLVTNGKERPVDVEVERPLPFPSPFPSVLAHDVRRLTDPDSFFNMCLFFPLSTAFRHPHPHPTFPSWWIDDMVSLSNMTCQCAFVQNMFQTTFALTWCIPVVYFLDLSDVHSVSCGEHLALPKS